MSNYDADAEFEAYAKEQERKAKEAANKKSTGGSGANYETIQWTGLETDQMKIIRAVGGPPNSFVDVTTAKTVRISSIVGDDGKRFRCILPEAADDPDNILWRIIQRVEAVTWNNKVKTFTVEQKHPDIFYQVTKNGLRQGDKQFNFDKGWKGQQKLIMNVIDREQMEWHHEHKHTMLLSKVINEGKDGRLFPEEGVPSYGFENQLANLFKYYKSWEKYDIGIVKTGLKDNPYRIINATKYFEEVPDYLKPLVNVEPLTDEERAYTRYDLSKLFGYTTSTKLLNKLGLTIQRIDAALGTHFYNELKDASDIEKAKWEAEKANQPVEADEEETLPVEEKPVTPSRPSKSETRRVAAQRAGKFDTSILKGWDKLTDEEKAGIVGVTTNAAGEVTEIQYSDTEALMFKCPSCSIAAPESYDHVCPSCGEEF